MFGASAEAMNKCLAFVGQGFGVLKGTGGSNSVVVGSGLLTCSAGVTVTFVIA